MIEDYYDPDFENLLREEEAIEDGTHKEFLAQRELQWEVVRYQRDFASISAVCTLVRNNHMTSSDAIKLIQNYIVG